MKSKGNLYGFDPVTEMKEKRLKRVEWRLKDVFVIRHFDRDLLQSKEGTLGSGWWKYCSAVLNPRNKDICAVRHAVSKEDRNPKRKRKE